MGSPVRIQRIVIPRDGDHRRVEVVLQGGGDLPASVVMQAAERLRRAMAALDVTDLRLTVSSSPDQSPADRIEPDLDRTASDPDQTER